MMSSADVAPYVRDNVPWLADIASNYIDTLHEASAYPFMGHAIAEVLEKISASTPQDEEDLRRFFVVVEQLLSSGDENVKDLVSIEIGEVLKDNRRLQPLFGPHLANEIVKIRKG